MVGYVVGAGGMLFSDALDSMSPLNLCPQRLISHTTVICVLNLQIRDQISTLLSTYPHKYIHTILDHSLLFKYDL